MSNSIARDVREVILRLCEDAASGVSLSVAIQVRYNLWDELSVKRVDPRNYLSADDYLRDVACVDLLRKMEDLPTSANKRANALANFWAAEKSCYQANERLSPFLFDCQRQSEEGVQRFIILARKYVKAILGPCPSSVEGRFGPGSTYADKGLLTTVADKMSSQPTLTGGSEGAWPWLVPWTCTQWASACANADRRPLSVRGNRFATVPKDCTKFRGIAIEPSINLFYQLGFGRLMKRRIAAWGFDLEHAQEIHKQAACEASITGSLATIDLSNASDTICRNLVKLLLPHRWFSALDSLRSPFTKVDGKWVKLEKFSSMGNGFTFELETVIFTALCCAVMETHDVNPIPWENVFVFGDDIIVPTSLAREVISVLRFFGLRENVQKTFIEGPFRESCGGDYLNGVDVRPHYLKESPNEPHEWIALANGLFRLGRGHHNSGHYSNFVHRARLRVLDAIPSRIRNCRGPVGLGDLVIHDHESRGIIRWRSGIRYWRVYRPAKFRMVRWHHFRDDVILACAVYGVGDGHSSSRVVNPKGARSLHERWHSAGITPRDAVLGYKLGWVPLS